jgi:hypothetical protein
MRRTAFLALAALITLGLVAPAAYAQPTPKVTINGLIDNLGAWSQNLQQGTGFRGTVPPGTAGYDFTRDKDEFYGRTRGRFDIVGELGSAKAVLGLEIDATYGQTGVADNGTSNQIATAQATALNTNVSTIAGQRSGTNSGFDLNTDVLNNIEVKWLYVEFPIPLIPIPATFRVGAQPFQTTYKVGTLATGDFAGANLTISFTPNVRWHITYANLEEDLTGRKFGFNNGNDYAWITSVEVTPLKGLQLRPTYAFFHATGTTNAGARVPVGQLSAGNAQTGPVFTQGSIESRHTVGIDSRFTAGPLSIRPTFFYQFGTRDQVDPFNTTNVDQATINAFLFDVINGFQLGPILFELRGLYTTGNRPKDQLNHDVNYYQPIDTDTGYGADGWGNILALGIDYFSGAIRTLGTGIGLDRYGRAQVGGKITYSFTPQLDLYALAQAAWTARSVDTDGTNTGTVMVPSLTSPNGDSSYIGTELNGGLTWRFAPGLALDAVYGYMFTGDALSTAGRSANDVQTAVTRVRFTF